LDPAIVNQDLINNMLLDNTSIPIVVVISAVVALRRAVSTLVPIRTGRPKVIVNKIVEEMPKPGKAVDCNTLVLKSPEEAITISLDCLEKTPIPFGNTIDLLKLDLSKLAELSIDISNKSVILHQKVEMFLVPSGAGVLF
jgi:hypothetical protein